MSDKITEKMNERKVTKPELRRRTRIPLTVIEEILDGGEIHSNEVREITRALKTKPSQITVKKGSATYARQRRSAK